MKSTYAKVLLALLVLSLVVGFVVHQSTSQPQVEDIDSISVNEATEGWVLVYQMKNGKVLSIEGIEGLVCVAEEE